MKQPTYDLVFSVALTIHALMSLQNVESFVIAPSSALRMPRYATIDTAQNYAVRVSSPNHAATLDKKMEETANGRKKLQQVKSKRADRQIQEVLSLNDFKLIVEEEKEQVVVVRTHAPWCKLCQAVEPMYRKFVKKHADKIKFVDCPMPRAPNEVHKALGIKFIPFVHIYHPDAGLVEERTIGRSTYSVFEKIAKSLVKGFCDIENGDCRDPYV
jgi:thiol-disulfide isomerase/thioredoxin